MKKKVLILTDSLGLPRSYPNECSVNYEETWPYQLKQLQDFCVVQISKGGGTLPELVEQSSYFESWSPDYVIIQCGIVDCAPRALHFIEEYLISSVRGGHFFLSKVLNKKIKIILRKYRKIERTSVDKFEKSLSRLATLFPNSVTIYISILSDCSSEYERIVPGISHQIKKYNNIIRSKENIFLDIQNLISLSSGVCLKDHHHLTKNGHEVVLSELKKILARSDEKF